MKIELFEDRKIVTDYTEEEWHSMRAQDITSTDIAALFGISPWLTEYELWHRKKNATIVELAPNPRMTWGNRLQDAIALGIAEDYKFSVRPMKEYIRLYAWRMGSSFDYAVEPNSILEVKNVDSLAYKDGWLIDGDSIEAPPHIELQGQYQMLVSGREALYIGALIGGNRVTLIQRMADPDIHAAIKVKVAAFWSSIDENKEPAPDFKADASFIAKMNGYAEPGKIMNAAGDAHLAGLVRDYKEWGQKATSAAAEKDGIRAQILTLIGDAEKVQGDGYTISAGVKPPTLVEAFTRKAYRDFRVYIKKS